MIPGLAFTAPWLLLGLAALPVLWLLLRAVPPAPIKRRFPGVALLLGLSDDDTVTDRTPWWLLLLRMLAVAAMIVALAGPVLNPQEKRAAPDMPLLVVLDGTWAGAAGWQARKQVLDRVLAEAGRNSRPVAIMRLTTPERPEFQAAGAVQSRLVGLEPQPWQPTQEMADAAMSLLPDGRYETYWMSDGLAREGRSRVLAALEQHGPVRAYESGKPTLALMPPQFKDGAVQLRARRSVGGRARDIVVAAHGVDPAGVPRVLARQTLGFDAGAREVSGAMTLPAELRARVERFQIDGERSAGAVALGDDTLRRREIALIAGQDNREGLELLSPLYYLRQALAPSADLLDGALMDVLPANPDVIILADVAKLSQAEQEGLLEWVEKGGLLLRFAGPRLAASEVSRKEEDALMPVRLRAGGRSVGGAMSWGSPKSLAAFPKGSPFTGLKPPEDVKVSAQVLAQPDPTLADRVIAQLDDGTPLVTRKHIGAGQVVLMHVTATAEWSTLPLSGLFVRMLERLSAASLTARPDAEALEGQTWQPQRVLDGLGRVQDAATLPGVAGEDVLSAPLGPDLRPGVYSSADRYIARHVVEADADLTPVTWPARIPVEGMEKPPETPLTGHLLSVAIALMVADVLASLIVSGRLTAARTAAGVFLLCLMWGGAMPAPVRAQAEGGDDAFAIAATSEVVLAHVLTGNERVDDTAHAGMRGLSETLFFRTSVEPADPMGVNLETDELAFFPFLYWPITPDQPTPSEEAYAKLNRYLRSGGMILFDTRDADIAGFGASSPNGRMLQELAAPLDIPPLEPVPDDHVLTRAFYLLQDFPGRHPGGDIWVEAAPPDAEKVEGMPFRDLNDGVTPVVIGGNDWAAAWAMDERGNALFPVGRGRGGERQREISYRFGVNLIMHVLTGNYKSDQVHVPALLERLGQ
ncbi:MAG: DUF4159 domain-containing protein [Sediminimonas qiaohouensis]|uniref:DUF4159 domain-containing protein n=1 Tax=Sediminimonas qiaohouensis TaxID=552061 RepID=A0A7C9L8Q8_9RHOB|nr:DUF4159 domain-containing protein [Sediminimonas qiaohouensis]MTJ05014.1 DUF4159 domain-containing protein [Sediminimonas qiaohouensis]